MACDSFSLMEASINKWSDTKANDTEAITANRIINNTLNILIALILYSERDCTHIVDNNAIPEARINPLNNLLDMVINRNF